MPELRNVRFRANASANMVAMAGADTSPPTAALLIGAGLAVAGFLQIAFWRSSAGSAIVKQSPLPPRFFDAIGVILVMAGLIVALGSLGG